MQTTHEQIANLTRKYYLEQLALTAWDYVPRNKYVSREAAYLQACDIKLATLTARFHYPSGVWVEV